MAAVATRIAEGKADIPTYHQVPETKYELDWADLVTLDLSQFDQPDGKQKLAAQLFDAIQKIGFFYITNFGLTQEQVDRQFAIGKEVFQLPTEEKLKYRADLEHGGYNGYKPLGLRQVKPGVYDNTEIYNIPKFIPAFEQPHPEIINANRKEIETFARHINDNIVGKLLVLFAIILELPEDYFLQRHRYEEKSDCHLRYMKYHHRTEEQNKTLGNVWVKGHTDFGSLTLLFRQPVSALQVRTPEGEWKWVKPYPQSITVNLADSLEFLTNGFLKSSIHRVVAPPPDQANIDRLGVLYFVRPEDSLELRPVVSNVLERLGYNKTMDGSAVGITAGEWVKARVAGGVAKDKARSDVSEQEIIRGKTAKYYD
ncbi:Clavaminate synthase-like protein [Daldinia vernicosa]|uniref:Clavaminate synthase-like protein n=1 Tax=Daldinia vernicosa TaxID=114800 RepID=UPI0020081033|nr:Clavaminate synthase-like protein [Daldinia vernicosa]KAI0852785.1 Clavaminate synthase-like protein [Daldinia vernicosa]